MARERQGLIAAASAVMSLAVAGARLLSASPVHKLGVSGAAMVLLWLVCTIVAVVLVADLQPVLQAPPWMAVFLGIMFGSVGLKAVTEIVASLIGFDLHLRLPDPWLDVIWAGFSLLAPPVVLLGPGLSMLFLLARARRSR